MAEEQPARYVATDWQAITKRFPFSTFDADQKSWRVLYFDGDTLPHDQLQETLAAIISRILARQLADSPAQRSAPKVASQREQDGLDVLKKIAQEWGLEGSVSESVETRAGESFPNFVLPDQIKIVSPREAKIVLYPRGLKCDNKDCNFYMVPTDLSKLDSLQCPDCKKGNLRQVSLIFFCEKCGYQHEITPRFTDPQKDGPVFKCEEDGCTGHLHLDLRRKRLTQSRWVCSRTKNETQVIYFCPFCSDWSKKNPKRMVLRPTTASYLKPMLYSAVYVGANREIKLADIEPIWSLNQSGNYTSEEKETIHDLGILNIHVIDNVTSYTAIYGYAPYGTDVQIRFFQQRNPDTNQFEYRAYMTQSQGKGLVIQLDKERIARVALENIIRQLGRADPGGIALKEAREYLKTLEKGDNTAIEGVYTWLSTQTKEYLAETPINELKRLVPLFTLLHSLEHALTYQASLRTGLEESAFVGKVLIDDCALLIFEREQVEAGGVEYLAHDLLMRWLNEAMKHVRDCRYQCHEGCVTCLYIRDPLCHPFFPSEVPSAYIFPNYLLNRDLLLEFWGITLSACEPPYENGSPPETVEGDSEK